MKQKKIAFFADQVFYDTVFSIGSCKNVYAVFQDIVQKNGPDNTIPYHDLHKRNDRQDFIIICLQQLYLPINLDIYQDYVHHLRLLKQYRSSKKYYYIFKPFVVSPIGYSKFVHGFFDKIFTRHDGLVDNKKYFKFLYPQTYVGYKDIPKPFSEKNSLCVLMQTSGLLLPKNDILKEKR